MSLSESGRESSSAFKAAMGILVVLMVVIILRSIGGGLLYLINIDLGYEFCRISEFLATPFGKIITYFCVGYLLSLILVFRLLRKWRINWFLKFNLICFFAGLPSSLDIFILQFVESAWMFVVYAICTSLAKLFFIFKGFKFLGYFLSILRRKSKYNDVTSFTLKVKRGRVIIPNPFAGIYVQGGAGSGKTESLLKPMIEQSIENGFAFIIYDFKGDLTPFAKQIMSARGIQRHNTLNFKEPLESDRFNPLNPDYLKSTAEVVELSKTLFYNLNPASIKKTTDNYFLDEAINLFTAIVIFLKNNKPAYCTIPHIIASLANNDIEKVITKVSTDFEALPYVSSLKNVIALKADKQVAGVIGSLQGSLAKFTSKELFHILSGNDFSPDLNNPDNPNRLSIINDSSLPSFYTPLISMVINICLKKMNVADRHKSVIFLDEAPTLYIPEFEQIPATARSNKIATVYAAQDYTQVMDKYGPEKAQTIISNLASQFYGRTTNVQSMKMISELFGKYDKVFETKSSGKSGEYLNYGDVKMSSNKSQSIQERYSVTSNELLQLRPGEFYSLVGNNKSHTQYYQVKQPKVDKDEDRINNLRKFSHLISGQDLDSNYIAINKAALTIFD